MKTGSIRTIQDLAAEVERRRASALDLVAATSALTMLNAGELHLEGQGEFRIEDLAHKQIADERGIPRAFYERLRREHRGLLDHTVNTLWRERPSRRLIRVLEGKVRADLSDRYRRLDNAELLEAILPVLAEIPDLQVPSCEITDSRLYLKTVAPRVAGEVKKGDVVQTGVVISNSEVGLGALRVQPMIFRLVCTNGMIAGAPVRRFHVGRQVDSEDAVSVFQDETLRTDDRAYWLKVRDVVKAAVSEARFQDLLAKMQLSATSEPIADVGYGVEVLAQRFSLSGDEQSSVLHHLAAGGDLTQWGALNAVTRASQGSESYDRATELEAVGGSILDMTRSRVGDGRSEEAVMSILDARRVWSRSVARIEAGTLSEEGLIAGRSCLENIRDAVSPPERSRVDLYIDLLQQAWDDRRNIDSGRRADS